jgi:hypothetical protein
MTFGSPSAPRSTETSRQRAQRIALSRRAERNPEPRPERMEPPARVSRSGLTLTHGAFRGADYGQVCAFLGLRPSKPHEDASGNDRRRRRGR